MTAWMVAFTKSIVLFLLENLIMKNLFFQIYIWYKGERALCPNLTVNHQTLEAFRKSKAEV